MQTAISVGTEKVGSRIYVTGNTYPIKDRLRSAGCKWDPERKQWWAGAAKASVIQSLVSQLDGAAPPEEDLSGATVYAKAEYKGRTYYVISTSSKTGKLRLTVLDGSISFWADQGLCTIVKTYPAREYRGRTQHQTLGGLQRFVKQVKSDEQGKRDGTAETKRCWECGCLFTYLDCKRNGGDWSDSYCGC